MPARLTPARMNLPGWRSDGEIHFSAGYFGIIRNLKYEGSEIWLNRIVVVEVSDTTGDAQSYKSRDQKNRSRNYLPSFKFWSLLLSGRLQTCLRQAGYKP